MGMYDTVTVESGFGLPDWPDGAPDHEMVDFQSKDLADQPALNRYVIDESGILKRGITSHRKLSEDERQEMVEDEDTPYEWPDEDEVAFVEKWGEGEPDTDADAVLTPPENVREVVDFDVTDLTVEAEIYTGADRDWGADGLVRYVVTIEDGEVVGARRAE